MVNLGEVTEIVNGLEFTLDAGAGYLTEISQQDAPTQTGAGFTANETVTITGDVSGASTTAVLLSSFDGTLNALADFAPDSLGTQSGVFNDAEATSIAGASGTATSVYNDNNKGVYILLKNLTISIKRTESRDVGTNALVYTYGAGDNIMTATLMVSTPELDYLNNISKLNINSDMTTDFWKIIAKDLSGNTKTFSAIGVLYDYSITKQEEGLVLVDIVVRISGDTITIS